MAINLHQADHSRWLLSFFGLGWPDKGANEESYRVDQTRDLFIGIISIYQIPRLLELISSLSPLYLLVPSLCSSLHIDCPSQVTSVSSLHI